ncbi:hypothetical protein PRZ48_008788 [Zasmidium cellare]|uniref:Uncharacterized protein n=1 Tax=Zasmidium cellare TaxID=395010 RepID=A0ABR0EGF5_ZASCE|nr:hypothetical protein PRZ48_008788 [Zasmidium cellare]
MQLTALLTLALGLTATTSAADLATTCRHKIAYLPANINKFCSQDFTVPSDYARNGLNWGPINDGRMRVTGPCSPAQPVSKDVCVRQMLEVCASGGPKGGGTRYFGRNGCQAWTIVPPKKNLPLIGLGTRGIKRGEEDVDEEI